MAVGIKFSCDKSLLKPTLLYVKKQTIVISTQLPIRNLFLWKEKPASLSIAFFLCAAFSILGLYRCGTISSEKNADAITITAAKIPRSLSASDLTKSKHKNATAVVELLMIKGIVMSLYNVLTSLLCL